MRQQLLSLGINCIDSYANFLTFDCAGLKYSAAELEQKMLHRGVILRGLQPYAMPNHLRVSIGLENENQQFIETLRQLLHE